ncbi:MAG TPA: ATP-grasp domain-containing protein [Gaiellaceae bacterium]|nr:ATP-grasp domain-containing protein [Gaiellaceae bacterium]
MPRQRTVLFVGAGRHQRRAILRAKELGLRVAAVDRNPDAPGLREADVVRVVDFADAEAVLRATARLRLDGVLTVSADRAVPVVAAVAEARGLPGIGVETAHLMTHKVAMRRRLAEAGVPQPRFAAVRTVSERRRAAEEVGFPAVLKPADSGGQRGVFRIESLDDVDAHLYEALAASPTGEAILEEFVEGTEMNGIVVARGGDAVTLTLSDRLRPPGIGFGVGWIHVFPAAIFGAQLEEAERVAARTATALGLRTGIAFPQLIATPDGRVVVVECAARIPGGQMADLVRFAVGVDLVEVQLRMALGDELPDELVLPRFSQPLAIRFLTAEPGPLPTGRVVEVGPLDKVLAFPGVVQAETYLQVGETIRPVRVDGDRRGYVIATGDTSLEALDRAEAAARLLDVEVEEPAVA